MAGRTLPPTSRIFGRRKSVWSRLFGTLALTLALAVTVFGIGTAVYLDRPQAPSPSTTIATPAALPRATAPEPEHDPLAAAAAVPAPPAAPAAAAPVLARIEPLAGSQAAPAAPPAQSAALEAPPSAAAPAAPPIAKPRHPYWVEYGVFAGPLYAKRLQQALARDGLAAVVVATHDRHGRKLLRVRSAPLAALADAHAAAATAKHALRLAALIHSGSPEAGAPAPRYWVQFGAFRKPAQAARLRQRLAQAGLATSVTAVRGTSGKPLFLVRSLPLVTHAAAVAMAVRARPVAEVPCLIGQARGHAMPARAPPRSVADSR